MAKDNENLGFDDIELITPGEEQSGSIEIDAEENTHVDKTTDKKKDQETDDNLIVLDDNEETEEDSDTDDKKDNKETGDGTSSDDKDSSNTLPPFAAALKEGGVLPDLDMESFDGTAESLIAAVEAEISKREFSKLNDDQKKLLEVIGSGGDIKPFLETVNDQKRIESEYKEVNDDNASSILRDYYKHTGMPEDEIEDLVEDLELMGSTKKRAESVLPKLTKLLDKKKAEIAESEKQKEQREREEYKKQISELKEAVYAKEEIIKGHKLNKQTKDKIINMITNPTEKDEDGTPLTAFQKTYKENPVEVETAINYLHILTDGFKKMDNLSYSKGATTSAARKLQETLDRGSSTNTTSGSYAGQNNNKSNNNNSLYDGLSSFLGE